MAVNLIATARLNTGPYMKGLQTIATGTAGLTATTVAGGKKSEASWADNERAAKAYERGLRQAGAAQVATTASTRQSTKVLRDHQLMQMESMKIADRISKAYRTMSTADAAYEAAKLRSAQSRLNLLRAQEAGLSGPALDSYVNKRNAAQIALARSAGQVANAQKAVTRTGNAMAGSLSSQRYLLHDLSRQASRYALGFAAIPAATLVAGAAWEHNFASVIRTSDLKDNLDENMGKFNALRDSLVGMAQAMPASFGDITEVATLANQMGIAASETAEFTRAVIMFSESSGVSVDQAATAFGRLKSLVADVGSDYIGLADSILKVGVNSVATEDEIINVTTQISSIAAQAGFTSKEMVGLAGAMASVRVPPELSRGVVTRVFGQIDKAVSAGGTGLDTLARISGRTSEQFKQQWGTEGASGVLFRDLIGGLQEAGNAARSEIESLGITSVRDVPVLLRLANAADSNGVRGGLLTQTMKDAENAAGETQKQYEIMAETVVGKLKILGNNIVAFFDAIGSSSLGSFGGFLDNLTEGIRDFTRSLDEPVKLFGMFELPWTNAEGLGFITNLSLMAAGFALLASVGTKIGAGVVAVRQFGQALAGTKIGSGFMSALSGASVGAALAPATKEAGKFAGALSTAGVVGGRALGSIARVATGPVGIALAAIAVTGKVFADNYYEASTSAKEFSASVAGIDPDNLIAVNNALEGISISGGSEFWSKGEFTKSVQPFEDGVESYRAGIEALIDARNSGEAGGWDRNNWWTSWGFEMGQWGARSGKALFDEVEGMQLVDDAIQGLVDSGNGERAISLVRNLHGTVDQLKYTMESTEGKAINELMENTFNAAGIEMTDANLHAFVNGSLKELSSALTGFEEGDKVADALFGGDIEQMGKFANTIDETAAAFIDFSAALDSGWTDAKGNPLKDFSLSNYTQELKNSMKAQKEWSNDLISVSEHASSGLIEHLASLGPAAAPLLAALADELGEGVTTSLDTLEEALSSKTAGLGNALAESMANRAWVRRAVGDDGLAGLIMDELGDDKMSQLYDAARGVGSDTVTAVMEGLARGDLSFEQAMQALVMSQPIKPVVELDTDSAERGLDALNAKLSRTKFSPQVDADTTIADFKAKMQDSTLNKIELDGDLTLEEAYAESREFQAWAEAMGIDLYLGANDLPAKLSVAALVAYANNQEVQIEIDALPAPAENAIWEIVTLANGERGYIEIDADNQLASEKIYQIDQETGELRIIDIDGENQDAINEVLAVRDEASSKPAQLEVTAVDLASGVIDHIARDRTAYVYVQEQLIGSSDYTRGNPYARPSTEDADGSIKTFYANGGINSQHVAQIAPAGAMRIWAEPETEGEAYIPFARSKRTRSLAILGQVAQRFGYGLSNGTNVAKFADGGQYMAQVMSRQRYTAASVRGSDQGAKVQVGPVTFANSSQKDQFREFTRTLNRVARGL